MKCNRTDSQYYENKAQVVINWNYPVFIVAEQVMLTRVNKAILLFCLADCSCLSLGLFLFKTSGWGSAVGIVTLGL